MTQRLLHRRSSRPRREARRRSGAVLVFALVALVVVMGIIASMLQGTLRVTRHMRTQRDLQQTEWLLQAGADRAAFRLTNEADYRGEIWNLPAEEIVGRGEGRVTIAASRQSDAGPWEVQVMAEYPTGSQSSICRSRTFSVPSQLSQAQE
jgi:type II secretory pathway component PulJ